MADEPSPGRAPPRRSRSAPTPPPGNRRRPLQFSLWELGVFVTVVCVLLGIAAVLGSWAGSLVALIVSMVFRVMAPVAVIVAAIYTRGVMRTFFLGVAIAVALQQLSTSGSLGSRLGQGRFDAMAILGGILIAMGCLASGVLAVVVRRAVESRGWDRESDVASDDGVSGER